MSKHPNIDALLQGCVSGEYTEWPLLRIEVMKLITENDWLQRQRDCLQETLNVICRKRNIGTCHG